MTSPLVFEENFHGPFFPGALKTKAQAVRYLCCMFFRLRNGHDAHHDVAATAYVALVLREDDFCRDLTTIVIFAHDPHVIVVFLGRGLIVVVLEFEKR